MISIAFLSFQYIFTNILLVEQLTSWQPSKNTLLDNFATYQKNYKNLYSHKMSCTNLLQFCSQTFEATALVNQHIDDSDASEIFT